MKKENELKSIIDDLDNEVDTELYISKYELDNEKLLLENEKLLSENRYLTKWNNIYQILIVLFIGFVIMIS